MVKKDKNKYAANTIDINKRNVMNLHDYNSL